jgi:hypothetical protein
MKNVLSPAALLRISVLALAYILVAVPANADPKESWVSVGPHGNPESHDDMADDGLGGQVNAIAVDPADSATIYIGASEGGIWKTTDGGLSWSPISDLALVRNLGASLARGTQSIGALAIDPSNHNIYAGTGNPNIACCLNGPGLGVFRSDKGGEKWKATGADPALGDNKTMSSSTVYKLIVRSGVAAKHVPNTVIAATDRGLFQYTDDGSDTWRRVSGGQLPANGNVTDLVRSSSRLYAAIPGSGIFRETPGGQLQFEPLTNGLRRGAVTDIGTGITISIGRIALAISRSNDQVLYAGLEIVSQKNGNDIAPRFYEIYKTGNGGDKWDALTMVPCGGPGLCSGREASPQLGFNNTIAVDPSNPDSVYVGQVDLWNAADGGKSGKWTTVRDPWVHVDFHDIVFDPTDSKVFYVANDGGVYKGILGGIDISWDSLTKNLVVGQCATIGQNPSNFNSAICGSWNNGNPMTNDGKTWFKIGGGDGFQAKIDAEPLNGFTTAYINSNAAFGGAISRDQRGTGPILEPFATIWTDENTSAFWTNPYIGGELLRANNPQNKDGTVVAPGALFITESADRLTATVLSCAYSHPPCPWQPFDPIGKSGNTTTVAFGSPIEHVYYVGTDTGEVWYGVEDFIPIEGGNLFSWELTTCSDGSSGRVNKIAADPRNRNRAFAVFDKKTGPGRIRVCNRSGRNNWVGQMIDDSFNPEVRVDRVTSIVVDPSVADTIYVGTDQGMYKGVVESGGRWTWTRSPGISHLWVSDMAIHDSISGPSGVVWASTYGRGVYQRQVMGPPITVPAALNVQAVQTGTVGKGEDLPSVGAKVSVSTSTAFGSAETPFYRSFATGSKITLAAPTQIQLGTASQTQGRTASQIQIGSESLRFVGWEVSQQSSGADKDAGPATTELRVIREHSEPTIRLTLTGQTTAVAKYERIGPRVKTLRVQAVLDGIEGATAPLRVSISATSPNMTGTQQSPFELTAPPNGQVVLTAPMAIVDNDKYLGFFGWVISNQVSSEATLSLRLHDNKTAFAIYREVKIPLR